MYLPITKSEAEYKTINVPVEVRCQRCVNYVRRMKMTGICPIVDGKIDPRATCLFFEKKENGKR